MKLKTINNIIKEIENEKYSIKLYRDLKNPDSLFFRSPEYYKYFLRSEENKMKNKKLICEIETKKYNPICDYESYLFYYYEGNKNIITILLEKCNNKYSVHTITSLNRDVLNKETIYELLFQAGSEYKNYSKEFIRYFKENSTIYDIIYESEVIEDVRY